MALNRIGETMFASGEWRESDWGARRRFQLAIGLLTIAMAVLAYGNSLTKNLSSRGPQEQRSVGLIFSLKIHPVLAGWLAVHVAEEADEVKFVAEF